MFSTNLEEIKHGHRILMFTVQNIVFHKWSTICKYYCRTYDKEFLLDYHLFLTWFQSCILTYRLKSISFFTFFILKYGRYSFCFFSSEVIRKKKLYEMRFLNQPNAILFRFIQEKIQKDVQKVQS